MERLPSSNTDIEFQAIWMIKHEAIRKSSRRFLSNRSYKEMMNGKSR